MAINEYEIYNLKHERGSFMQSLLWSEVKNKWKSETAVVRDSCGNVTAGAQILVRKLPLVPYSFMYIPRGPLWDGENPQSFCELFKKIEALAKKHRCFCLRADPQIDETDTASIELLKSLGFLHRSDRVGYENTQCRENYVLFIRGRSQEEIFGSLRPKCRYNIRLAERKGVECRFYGEEMTEVFYRLLRETAQRDGFEIRSREYYERLLRTFGENAKLCISSKDGEALSAAIYLKYGNRATYLVGASSNSHREYMPNYLMQWTMIKQAVSSGVEIYDFGGIPYYYDENHRNFGVYRFKRQFSGEIVTYAGEFEYIFSKRFYNLGKHFI
ncbi:MAG: peptidoglycan bridge formation glycyltransferase FemA/FemB family protein [Eubacteriales bacterium]|nr:peptidoglycan bridge formation glycyltransferase FemA/FemB family protein [Eubacteriales bacterium]